MKSSALLLGSMVIASAVVLCGCAGVSVTHVPPGDVSPGVHFTRSRPYLLISKQIKAGSGKTTLEETNTSEKAPATIEYSSSIVYLPDPSQEYTVTLQSGLGSANGSVKLADGWMLTEFGATADSKTTNLVSTAATLAGTVITAAAKAAAPAEGLYLIVIAPDGTVKLKKQSWFP